ncbi:hypothetical protein FALCPG4_018154 [Fusarium falciforme]
MLISTLSTYAHISRRECRVSYTGPSAKAGFPRHVLSSKLPSCREAAVIGSPPAGLACCRGHKLSPVSHLNPFPRLWDHTFESGLSQLLILQSPISSPIDTNVSTSPIIIPATAAMPASQGNLTGTPDPEAVPHGHWDSFPEEPFPLYAGTKSIIYRSEDGKVVVGMLREKGKDTLVWPVDEFLFVTEDSIKVQVHGGEEFTLGKGDVMVMKKGRTITFECSDDFANVAVFIDLQEKVSLV